MKKSTKRPSSEPTETEIRRPGIPRECFRIPFTIRRDVTISDEEDRPRVTILDDRTY